MNYRHAFHAGNFADVHKHVALIALLEHLGKKPAPYFVLDTHAGRGRYDLSSREAERGGEWRNGVEMVRKSATTTPLLQRYLSVSLAVRGEYSGSPLIIAGALRDKDRAAFVELNAEDAGALKKALGPRKRIAVMEADGYASLKAHLPPKENRGLVLIDPPFEKDSEFVDLTRGVELAHKRWPTGIYCIWYPLKAGAAEQKLFGGIAAAGIKKVLRAELFVRPADSPLGLNGSGLLIVNPPWQFDAQLRELSDELLKVLAPARTGSVRVDWLVGESE